MALSGGNKRATTLLLNASPYRAIVLPYRPQVQDYIEATTILTRGEAARDSEAKLQKLLQRIYNIRVFDPACGSGNFLIIAYRELRKLESRIFERQKAIAPKWTQWSLPMTGVRLTQFFGIELTDFAAETAKLSLWIAEYQMNEQFKAQFGSAPPALPLRDSGNIVQGNACREDWLKVCPHVEGSETYIVGNPPYLGSVYQTAMQKEDTKLVFSSVLKAYKDLDYVASWFVKGANYIQSTDAEYAFVATNSICQGEQVAMLWPLIYARGLEIGFAHQSFKWQNNAAKNAAVICVVVGVRRCKKKKKLLFIGELCREVKNIGPYLIEMDNIIIKKISRALSRVPRMDYGNKPTDGGNLILSPLEKNQIHIDYPASNVLTRRYLGSQEFIKGLERWCLWITEDNLPLAKSIPSVCRRLTDVQKLRSNSPGKQANDNAKTPHRFVFTPHQDLEALIVPSTSSERRIYLPVGFVGSESIISNSALAVYGAPGYLFSIVSSRLHSLWTASVGGRMKTDYRYSNTLVYNTFPIPDLSDDQKAILEGHTIAILGAREVHPGKTIAWLYDPETMPANLLQAHKELDETLEQIYIGRSFKSDTERLEHLFKRYANMIKKEQAA